jgi:hypothetical protein
MATNAVAATIAHARKLASNPATNVPCSLASIATAAGYPGSAASPVRALARRNGHGARANGQGRYAHNTPAQFVALLTGAQVALQPSTPAAKAKAYRKATVRQAWLGKQRAAAAAPARKAKANSTQATPAQPAQQ